MVTRFIENNRVNAMGTGGREAYSAQNTGWEKARRRQGKKPLAALSRQGKASLGIKDASAFSVGALTAMGLVEKGFNI